MNKPKPSQPPKSPPEPPLAREIMDTWEAVSGVLATVAPHLTYKSREQITYSFGAATVKVIPAGITGSREGKPGELTFSGDSIADFIAWAAEILKTGRTVIFGKGVHLSSLRVMPRTLGSTSVTLTTLDRMVSPPPGAMAGERLLLSPQYQRGDRWTLAQRRTFVGSYLEGMPIPPVYAQRYHDRTHVPEGKTEVDMPDEVIDGKQRLTALLGWYHGEFPAELSDGTEIWYRDTNEVDRRAVPMITILYVDLSLVDRLNFYLKINRGGTPHTDEEIAKVRAMRDEALAAAK